MNWKNSRSAQAVETLSTVLLFILFAFLTLTVIFFGARTYRGIASRMDQNYGSRTALAYLANKVRQHDEAGAIRVAERDGLPILELDEAIGGEWYTTRIYCSGGVIRELFTRRDSTVSLDAGQEIVEARALNFADEDGGITATLTGEEGTESIFLSRRSAAHE